MFKFLRRVNRVMDILEGVTDDTALATDDTALAKAVNITPSPSAGRVIVKNKPEDAPEWRRMYTATFAGGFRIEVEMASRYGRSDRSFLFQPNGKLICFDLHAIADHIIDRELCPIVEALAEEILALDRAYMHGERNQFIDEKGTTWRRIA